jgi:hypothetical protein
MILALDNNMLTGSIPIALGKLPVELASCTNISTLALGKNMLNGNIPAAIRKLQALQNLDLSTSELNGEIPAELVSCTNLKVPDIQSKQLTAPRGIYNVNMLSTSSLFSGLPIRFRFLNLSLTILWVLFHHLSFIVASLPHWI